MRLQTLTPGQVAELEDSLARYDLAHAGAPAEGAVSIGFFDGSRLIAGADGQMTAFHILYVSTVFVAEAYRRRGIGRRLMAEVEKRAAALGANMIRLDTFDWQGEAFYAAIGYRLAGSYTNPLDGFSESFYYKMLTPEGQA